MRKLFIIVFISTLVGCGNAEKKVEAKKNNESTAQKEVDLVLAKKAKENYLPYCQRKLLNKVIL